MVDLLTARTFLSSHLAEYFEHGRYDLVRAGRSLVGEPLRGPVERAKNSECKYLWIVHAYCAVLAAFIENLPDRDFKLLLQRT